MRTVSDKSDDGLSRRRFLANTSALGAASFLGLPRTVAAEPPPEIQRIRLVKIPAICLASEYLAEELLRLEGFSEIEYVELDQNTAPELLMANRADISIYTPPSLLPNLDAGKPVVVLAGLHGGCYELFANERVRTIRDLKGKRIAVSAMNATEYYFIAAMVAYVGVDPRKDIHWVDAKSYDGMMQSFMNGQVDAVLAFPPQPQDLRARKVGQVIVNTAQDRPWGQYFCRMAAARKEFVAKHPIATKRAVRALLKAADICAREPERAARYIVGKGYEVRYDVSLEVIKSLSYDRWRTDDPEDSLRFYGVRLHEVGMIKTNPQKLIATGSDWRFLNQLKKELKA
jgi:NitT/TauT family transport system substrate-binding protein